MHLALFLNAVMTAGAPHRVTYPIACVFGEICLSRALAQGGERSHDIVFGFRRTQCGELHVGSKTFDPIGSRHLGDFAANRRQLNEILSLRNVRPRTEMNGDRAVSVAYETIPSHFISRTL